MKFSKRRKFKSAIRSSVSQTSAVILNTRLGFYDRNSALMPNCNSPKLTVGLFKLVKESRPLVPKETPECASKLIVQCTQRNFLSLPLAHGFQNSCPRPIENSSRCTDK